MSRVLVVSRSPQQRDQLVAWFAAEGYQTSTASDFMTARRELDLEAPDLVVADVKLDAYNGLHLAIWSLGHGLNTRTILIGEADRVLEREAELQRAAYLHPPLDQHLVIACAASMLKSYSPSRRFPRKRVDLPAFVGGLPASVVDLSLEGLRLTVPNADNVTLPVYFTVRIPSLRLDCRVKRVWLGHPSGMPDVLWCGATIPSSDSDSRAPWRDLLDNSHSWGPAIAQPAG